jgi:hypothetical protein
MSNVFVTLFIVALMLVAVMTWSQVSYNSVDSGAQAWKEMVDMAEEVSRTDIEVTDAQMQAAFVEVLTHNSGEVHLAQFAKWDVLVQYFEGNGTYHLESLSYTEDAVPSNIEWTVAAIYSDESLSQQEVFEPGVLSPGEVMLMKLKLNPLPGVGTTNRVVLSTPNGVVASAQFAG